MNEAQDTLSILTVQRRFLSGDVTVNRIAVEQAKQK